MVLDKNVKPKQDEADPPCERVKERRNPSADAHEEPMSEGKPLVIGRSWTRAIRYRPSLCHRLSLTFLSCLLPLLGCLGVANAEPAATARANASLALKAALDELQQQAGPDQRITARANLLDEGIAQPHLTGVWDSWEIKATAPPVASDYARAAKDAKFRRWLVSTATPDAASQVGFASQPLTAPVTLLGAGTLGAATPTTGYVRAEKVASPGGAYAWAVLDEGVKARINTPFTDGATTAGAKTQQLGAGERPGVEFMPGLSALFREYFRSDTAFAQDMSGGIGDSVFPAVAEQWAPGTSAALKPLTHDVSLHATGLFTDVARGGLRQDFHLLTRSTSLPAAYSGKGVYISRLGLATAAVPSDPKWATLQQYARLYLDKVTSSAGVPVITAAAPPSWQAATASVYSPPTINRAPPSGMILMPTIAKVQMLFGLVARPLHGPWIYQYAGVATHALHLTYTPIVTLHNPYSIALECTDLRLDFADVPFAARVFCNDQPMSIGLVPINRMSVMYSGSGYSKKFGMNLRSGPPPTGSTTIRFQPGEVRTFSLYLDPSQPFGTNPDIGPIFDWRGTGLTENMIGVPGIQPQAGFSLDWWVPSDMTTQYHDSRYGLIAVKETDRVKVEFAPLSMSNFSYNHFVVTMVLGTGGAKTAVDVNYEKATGLQEFLLGKNGTLTMAEAVTAGSIAESNATPLGQYTHVKPFALFTLRAKTTSGGRHQTKPWCFDSGVIGASSQKLSTEHPAHHSHEIEFQQVDGPGVAEAALASDTMNRGYFVAGNDALSGRSFGLLADLPLAPIQTLAGLNGANPGGGSGYLPRFAQPIGNSWAHPLMGSENLLETKTGGNYLDHSFLLNLALYDGYFFSGLADQGGAFGTGKSTTTLAQSLAAGTPLDDPRLLLSRPAGRTAADFPGAVAATNAYSSIGAWLLQQGAFNINSTSVPSWKAMLASIHDADAIYNRLSVQFMPLTATTSLEARISRFRLPASHSAADGAVAKDAYWLGAREYSDAQLKTLAENIVAQIRLRGPFLSLAEFVNRRLGTDATAQRGVLQQAIDDSNLHAPVAQAANAGPDISAEAVASYKYANPAAGTGASYQGAPGYLTQADLLNVLGNAATARSDTFIIRAYGEAHDQAGTPSATAVCEAVFQRLPDWVDPADPAATPPAALTSQTNRTQGRKFKLLAFRWLQPGEI
jgi:hypothetical protein